MGESKIERIQREWAETTGATHRPKPKPVPTEAPKPKDVKKPAVKKK